MIETLDRYNLRQLYQNWVEGAGPFECFVRKTNFVSLRHYPDIPIRQLSTRASKFFQRISPQLALPGDNWLNLVDLPGIEAIRVGFLLQQKLKLKPVLTFSSPLHPYGLVGGDRYVNSLVYYGSQLTPIQPRGYVLILDSGRYREQLSPKQIRRSFNNQYELTADDLPSLEMLDFLSIKGIRVFNGGTR